MKTMMPHGNAPGRQRSKENHRASGRPPPPLSILDLDDGVLILVSLYLDLPSLSSFLRSNRRLHGIERRHCGFLWETRSVSQHGRLAGVVGVEEDRGAVPSWRWKEVARNLHRGTGNYHGFSLDIFTSGFAPYPMDLSIEGVREGLANRYGFLRWRTLGDAMTRVEGRQSRRDGTGLLETIAFSEVELVAGSNILVPNHYFGWYCGPSIIGVYPGGSFFLLRQEAIPADRLDGVFLYGLSPSDDSGGRRRNVINDDDPALCFPAGANAGTEFVGAVTMELVPFAQDVMRLPTPVSARLELVLDDGTNSHRTRSRGTIAVAGMDDRFRIDVSIAPGDGPYDVLIKAGGEVRGEDGERRTVENRDGENSILEFMASSRMFGWLQGDCIIGLVKDRTERRTGSFFLQLRNQNRLFALGINDYIESLEED